MIIIVDYGLGNLLSIRNMLRKAGHASEISNQEEVIAKAEKLILPGVGHFDSGMKNLRASGLESILKEKIVIQKTPVLGICLGMQLLTEGSEEGNESGLGWIKAKTLRFTNLPPELKVPHMAWSEIVPKKKVALLDGLPQPSRFYFVHSFFVKCLYEEDVLAEANYGSAFCCALQHDNIIGVQFHPEKSHRFGFQLLKNFAEKY